MSTEAKACPMCGAKVPHTKWWLWGPMAFNVVLFVWGAATGPKNTVELAEMETASCMQDQGGEDWRASNGITLDTFCKTKGAIIGISKACEINPSQCQRPRVIPAGLNFQVSPDAPGVPKFRDTPLVAQFT
jgi:hypothetical protein